MPIRRARVQSSAGLEVSTGALLGGGRDPDSFYLRRGAGAWGITYPGRTAVTMTDAGGTANLEGVLLNARTINAIFDDDNAGTLANWAYPSGPAEPWDPDRNVEEFTAFLPTLAANGINMVSVGLQGGNPRAAAGDGNGNPPTWIVSAFNADGSLKTAWMTRLGTVLRSADANGIVVLVQLFYQRQETRLTNEAAALAASDNIADWLASSGYKNILVGVQNEVGVAEWAAGIWQPARAHELITRIKTRQPALIVGTGFHSLTAVTDAVISASDYISYSGNSVSAAGAESYIDAIRASGVWTEKPIIQIEDATRVSDAQMDAPLKRHVGFGYHDDGPSAGTVSNYTDGWQWIPAKWANNTASKQAFLSKAASYAGV